MEILVNSASAALGGGITVLRGVCASSRFSWRESAAELLQLLEATIH